MAERPVHGIPDHMAATDRRRQNAAAETKSADVDISSQVQIARDFDRENTTRCAIPRLGRENTVDHGVFIDGHLHQLDATRGVIAMHHTRIEDDLFAVDAFDGQHLCSTSTTDLFNVAEGWVVGG